jgi:hypothetical protein
MRYRTQSANVLNEADRFQAILDWQLFSSEQDARLFNYNEEVDWKPGVPLYDHPHSVDYNGCSCYDCRESEPIEDGRYYGNHVRPFLQTIEYYDDDLDGWRGNSCEQLRRYQPMLCESCDVWWLRDENPSECWVCGAEFPGLKRLKTSLPGEHLMRHQSNMMGRGQSMGSIFEEFEEAMAPMVSAAQRAYSQMSAYITSNLNRDLGYAWRSIMQESLNYPVIEAEESRPPTPEPGVFGGRPELSLIPKVSQSAALVGPWVKDAPWRPRIGRLLREAGPAIFEKPPIKVPQFNTYKYYASYDDPSGWSNPQATDTRRRRNHDAYRPSVRRNRQRARASRSARSARRN